jgi:hypothetical protein
MEDDLKKNWKKIEDDLIKNKKKEDDLNKNERQTNQPNST